jgi:serine protease inhibitor
LREKEKNIVLKQLFVNCFIYLNKLKFMKTNYGIAIIIAGCFTIISCKKSNNEIDHKVISLTKSQQKIVGSSNSFGLKLFKEVARPLDPAKNFFISPLSVSMAMTMTYNGAATGTRDSIQKTLGFQGLTDEDINQSCHDLMASLLGLDPKVTMEIANSIWYEQTETILPSFLEVNQTYFDAQISRANFLDPATVGLINNWVNEKTHHKIPQIIDRIPADVIMYLINAIYFKGTWKYEFDKNKTSKQTFMLSDGSSFLTDFMVQKGTFKYVKNDLFSAIELPYGDDNFSMMVFVPSEGKTCLSLLSQLDDTNWNAWGTELNETQNVQVYLPKFKFSFDTLLNKPLESLGMSIAFTANADFSRINGLKNLYITRVIHKSFVDVNEEGTEAAAVTVVEIGKTSIGPGDEITYFRADRPFIFAIKEKQTNTILFMGLLNKPVSE